MNQKSINITLLKHDVISRFYPVVILQILVDDLLIYNGVLDVWSNNSAVKPFRTIVFSPNHQVTNEEKSTILK